MASRGFVVLKPGEAATASAAAEMDAELPFSLAELVPAIAAALARHPFRERIISSAWAQANPTSPRS